MSSVVYPNLELRSDGHLCIAGTGFKVRMLVEEHLATRGAAEDIQQAHPQLTLGQIHSALAYYYDHKEVIDREIEELNRFAEEYHRSQGESLLGKKLRESGKELP